jgi:hypothetical protein
MRRPKNHYQRQQIGTLTQAKAFRAEVGLPVRQMMMLRRSLRKRDVTIWVVSNNNELRTKV